MSETTMRVAAWYCVACLAPKRSSYRALGAMCEARCGNVNDGSKDKYWLHVSELPPVPATPAPTAIESAAVNWPPARSIAETVLRAMPPAAPPVPEDREEATKADSLDDLSDGLRTYIRDAESQVIRSATRIGRLQQEIKRLRDEHEQLKIAAQWVLSTRYAAQEPSVAAAFDALEACFRDATHGHTEGPNG